MKKMTAIFCIVLCLATVLTACGAGASEPEAAPTAEPTAEPTPEPTPAPTPEPDTVEGTVIALRAPGILTTLDYLEEVEVVGEYADPYCEYYTIKTELGCGVIEKRLVRMEGEEPFAEKEVYAQNATLYSNYHLYGEGIELARNEKLIQLEDLQQCAMVRYNDELYFVRPSQISDRMSSSGRRGGGVDGSNINIGGLSYRPSAEPALSMLTAYVTEQKEEVTGKGVCICKNAEVYLSLYDYEDTVKILSYDDEWVDLYIPGYDVKMERRLVRIEGEEPYEPWEGYARGKDNSYTDIYMLVPTENSLTLHVKYTVLQEFDTCYLVEYNGDMCYAPLDAITLTDTTRGGGGGGGGDSGDWSISVL